MENTETVVDQKSTILSEEQVATIASGEEVVSTEEIVLPSEEAINALPEKYAGKSAEEVYKLMKVEEDFKNGKKEEVKTEEVKTEVPENVIKEFTDKLIENGGEFSEENYKELEGKGYSKDFVDNYKAGVEAKQAEEVGKTFSEAGTSQEDFQKAGEWARDNWDETRVSEFNEAMNEAYASGNKAIQKSLIRSLTDGFKSAPKDAAPIHTNAAPEVAKVAGYTTKSEYFADVNNSRYSKDPSYRAIVEQKFLKTNRSNW